MARLAELAEKTDLNRIEWNDREIGVITSGVSYQYVREVCPQASVLKLGMTHPLPRKLISRFAKRVERLFVVEELDPFLEDQVRAMGFHPIGKARLPITGELTPALVAAALLNKIKRKQPATQDDLPPRPPVMCPGCPHRGLFHVLNKLKCVVFGDIGCYTLGVLPPLAALDTCICMGAGVGNALGLEKAVGDDHQPVVAVIGDSTFVHSGITGLVNIVYNGGHSTVIIVDNSTTAMTGHQDHPATGRTLQEQPTHTLRFEDLARAIGVKDVTVVDPHHLKETEEALKRAIATKEPSVIISRRPCVLIERRRDFEPLTVDEDKCVGCRLCLRLGCPAMETIPVEGSPRKRRSRINPVLCQACGLCVQACTSDAISRSAGG